MPMQERGHYCLSLLAHTSPVTSVGFGTPLGDYRYGTLRRSTNDRASFLSLTEQLENKLHPLNFQNPPIRKNNLKIRNQRIFLAKSVDLLAYSPALYLILLSKSLEW